MSFFDGRRLPARVFKIDSARMRRGWYSDHYFNNVAMILEKLARERYRFEGTSPLLEKKGVDVSKVEVGNIEAELQYFTKREPFSIVCGIDHALAILKECAGYFNRKRKFVNTFKNLEIDGVQDGDKLAPWLPALKIRGRYRDFAILETPTLGAIARRTRIATNVYETLEAARGKPVFFFSARFDIHEAQAGDGYAYKIAVERYNHDYGGKLKPLITTGEQGDWWGMKGAGTTSHSFVLCFLRDTAESMMAFARVLPVDVKRIALVDTNNDNIGDSLKTGARMFKKYVELKEKGCHRQAQKYVLFGVRADTASEMRDVSIEPTGDEKLDCGVNPRLVFRLREALDSFGEKVECPKKFRSVARRYFRNVKILVSGGFDPEKIRLFERLKVPADIYGIGSYLLRGKSTDFTADIVRVKIGGSWRQMAKEGRRPLKNRDLIKVR